MFSVAGSGRFVRSLGLLWLLRVSVSFANPTAADVEAGAATDAPPSKRTCAWDVVLGHAALPAASGADTRMQTRLGIRIRNRQSDAKKWFWSREATVWGHGESQGTAAIAIKRGLVGLDARLVRGIGWGTRLFQVAPFSFVQLGASGGFSQLQVGSDARIRPLVALAASAGVGLEYRLGSVALRLELGLGVRNHQPELLSGLSLGWGEVPVAREPAFRGPGESASAASEPDEELKSPPWLCLSL